MFLLVFRLSAAGSVYLCFSLTLLLIQRAFVTGMVGRASQRMLSAWRRWKVRNIFHGIYPLAYTEALRKSGNKSYRLSVLKNAGLPVPDGLVIRSDAIQAYSGMSKKQKKKFSRLIWKMVGEESCVIRSSAMGEDGSDQSFAGVFESVLEVQKKGMRKALDKVVKSFSSTRASSYNAENTADHDGNILVQKMIRSEYAGVLFTQDPSAPGLMMVEMVAGQGDDLVSGRVTPQSLRFGRFSKAAFDDEVAPIDLSPLLDLGDKIERTFGSPQDIEWAYADGVFHIVQSRDITTISRGKSVGMVREAEWQRILGMYQDADPDEEILEQDEMFEVLPRPTPLSFDLMARLWASGGSVDLACRDLGVTYSLPEGRPGHLVSVFGRTFVDRRLKDAMALRLNKAKARQLRKMTSPVMTRFRQETMPALQDEICIWKAIDFNALPEKQIVTSIRKLVEKLTREVYVEAEKINILASFTQTEASNFAADDKKAHERMMNPVLRHAPVSIINACASLSDKTRESTLMDVMGHRAILDYELSLPRYREAPDLLWPLLDSATPTSGEPPRDPDDAPADPVDLAIAFQDLKEQAKHEALRLVDQIRRGLLALAEANDMGDLIFYLELDEVFDIGTTDVAALMTLARVRKERAKTLRKFAPKNVILTLRDCEKLSSGALANSRADGTEMGGTCVSGDRAVSGRVFIVPDGTMLDKRAFAGFLDGDILVSRMINPAWLPYVQRSGAVLSEVGGWLSHMAIVAREKGVPMLVGCTGLDRLETGMNIQIGPDGHISILEAQPEQALKQA